MNEKIKQIFARHFKRLESSLKEVNCPQLYLDAISKYFKFCEEDIIKQTRSTDDELSEKYENFNR